MGETYIVHAAGAVRGGGLAVADEAVGPPEADVLDGRAGLLDHGVVGQGEVAAGGVGREEDGDVVDGGGRVGGVRREGHPAVGGDVEGDFHFIWAN